jgi:biopolymer transport protein ExbD
MRAIGFALLLGVAACEAEAPKRAAPIDVADPEVLLVQVAEDGTVIIDGRFLLEDQIILARVQAFHAKHPAGRAELRCDSSTLHGRGVRILELLQEGEVSRVSMLF